MRSPMPTAPRDDGAPAPPESAELVRLRRPIRCETHLIPKSCAETQQQAIQIRRAESSFCVCAGLLFRLPVSLSVSGGCRWEADRQCHYYQCESVRRHTLYEAAEVNFPTRGTAPSLQSRWNVGNRLRFLQPRCPILVATRMRTPTPGRNCKVFGIRQTMEPNEFDARTPRSAPCAWFWVDRMSLWCPNERRKDEFHRPSPAPHASLALSAPGTWQCDAWTSAPSVCYCKSCGLSGTPTTQGEASQVGIGCSVNKWRSFPFAVYVGGSVEGIAIRFRATPINISSNDIHSRYAHTGLSR